MELAMAGLISVEIGFLTDICFRMIRQNDKRCNLFIDYNLYRIVWGYSVLTGIWIGFFLKHWKWYGQAACGVLAAYLLIASVQDFQTYEVYDFLHCIMFVLGIVLIIWIIPSGKMGSFLLYVLVQKFLFMRMYGAADGFVFLVCALFESVFGEGMLTFLQHMALTYLVLGVIQGWRKNIDRKGNLKQPVAFVPYIAATVWLFL